MTNDEFVRLVNGKPWKNRACTFKEMDCWGLVVLYYRSVMGIELHHLEGYEAGKDFVTCYEGESEFWANQPVATAGCIAVFYRGDVPSHIGVMLTPTKCLHSRGESGFVRIDSSLALMKVYSKVEFKRYGQV